MHISNIGCFMFNIKKLITVLCLLLLCPVVYSANWRYVMSTSGGGTHYLDVDSVQTYYEDDEDLVVSFWAQTTYKTDQRLNNGKTYRYTKTFYYISCYSKELTSREFIAYNQHNKIVYNGTIGETAYRKVVPDTLGEGLLQKACALYQ